MKETQKVFHEAAEERVAATRALHALGLPVLAGGADSVIEHPLGAPTVTGTEISMDLLLQQPVRITRMIMDMSLQRFVADRIFASGGGVTGGAVVYDTVQQNELYLDRDVQQIQPNAEFPVVTSERLTPSVATVEKWGGRFYYPDEARDRNDVTMFTNRARQLTNTIVRKLNQRAIAVLDAAITADSRTLAGNDWSAVVTGPSGSASNHTAYPAYDFAKVQKQADTEELGIVYDLWVINPQEYLVLKSIYGGDLNSMLADMGASIYVSNRVTAGTAYVVAERQVGQMRMEQPLQTVTYRQDENERTWVQSGVRPLFFVDNSFAVVQMTGLAG